VTIFKIDVAVSAGITMNLLRRPTNQ